MPTIDARVEGTHQWSSIRTILSLGRRNLSAHDSPIVLIHSVEQSESGGVKRLGHTSIIQYNRPSLACEEEVKCARPLATTTVRGKIWSSTAFLSRHSVTRWNAQQARDKVKKDRRQKQQRRSRFQPHFAPLQREWFENLRSGSALHEVPSFRDSMFSCKERCTAQTTLFETDLKLAKASNSWTSRIQLKRRVSYTHSLVLIDLRQLGRLRAVPSEGTGSSLIGPSPLPIPRCWGKLSPLGHFL